MCSETSPIGHVPFAHRAYIARYAQCFQILIQIFPAVSRILFSFATAVVIRLFVELLSNKTTFLVVDERNSFLIHGLILSLIHTFICAPRLPIPEGSNVFVKDGNHCRSNIGIRQPVTLSDKATNVQHARTQACSNYRHDNLKSTTAN